jgi:hypothetical protein
MGTREMRDLPGRLEAVRQRFECWRHTRKQRSSIPDSLWAAAVKLVGRYGICRTARTLRVDYYSLKKRVETTSVADRDQPVFRVGGRVLSGTGSETGTRATFVELPPPTHPSGECILELESAAGAKMRVELRGIGMPELVALTRNFWDHAP